jgi:geranylgeranyl pyrophosphate synthase
LGQSFNLIQTELDQVADFISGRMRSSEIPMDPYLQYLSARTGKMIRPALLLLSGKVSGGIRDEHIPVAAMIEMIYKAFLLHNQIDSMELLYFNPRQKILHNNTAFLLFGDLFLSQALALQSCLQIRELQDILSQTVLSLITGGLKLKLRGDSWDIDQHDYIRIIEAKTAALFQSSCRLGAIIAGASSNQIQILSEYGYRLGMAYQFADDLLTVLNAQEQIADAVTAERLLKKQVLPVIHCLNQNRNFKVKEEMSLQSLILQMQQTDSVNYTLDRIKKFTNEARLSLRSLSSDVYTQSLSTLADLIWDSVSSAEAAI